MFKLTINNKISSLSDELNTFHAIKQFLISIGWNDLGTQSISNPENITYYGVSNGNWCLYYGKRVLANQVAWYLSHKNITNNFLNIYTGSKESEASNLPANVFTVLPTRNSYKSIPITIYASQNKIFIVSFDYINGYVISSGNTNIDFSYFFSGYKLFSFFDLGDKAIVMNDVYIPYTIGYSLTTSHRINLIVAKKTNTEAYYYFNLPRAFLHDYSEVNNPLFDRVKIYGAIPSTAKNAFVSPLTVWVRDKKLNDEFTFQLPDDIYYTTKSYFEIQGEAYITLINNIEYYTIPVYPWFSSYILLKKYD